jgi:hypothetical protein
MWNRLTLPYPLELAQATTTKAIMAFSLGAFTFEHEDPE